MVHGTVAPGFEPVRDAFERGFRTRGEIGAALSVRFRGEVVVDLWGGVADPATGRPWERDTPCVAFSVTKGLAAMRMLQLADQGRFDPDAPVAEVWPDFARHGKAKITGRVLLDHRAGLCAVDAPLSLDDFRDPVHRVHAALAAQRPLWEPDTDQGYGATVWGAYVGALHHHLTGESLGEAFRREIAAPLGLDAWIGSPPEVVSRAAKMVTPTPATLLTRHIPTALTRRNMEGRMFRRILHPRGLAHRAFVNPTMGPERMAAINRPEVLALDLPWMSAVLTADALSKAYDALLHGRIVPPQALRPLFHRESWSERDRVLHKPIGWSRGFVKDEPQYFTPSPRAFGHPGAGGALGWADPDLDLSIGYLMNRMDWRIRSPRAVALCRAIVRCAAP